MKAYRVLNMISNIDNWMAYLWYKSSGKKGAGFTFRLRNQFNVSVPNQIIPEFKESFFEEVYFKHLPKKLFTDPAPVVLDIGANVGFFSLLAWYKLPAAKILAFEPIARNFKLLQKNTAGIPANNLLAQHAAVSDVVGEIVLRFNEQDITTSASLLANSTGGTEEVVASTTLAAIFEQHQLRKVDLLKMDCEGAEYGIIYNSPAALFDAINCIAMETHPGSAPNENTQSMMHYLEKLGYLIKRQGKDLIWAYKPTHQWR
ncbi:MAG: FkbM family methyltransferase [Sphingobacteriaceae bacterium]|nr:FkbM family methyltransferase [Sphingobacteriaceae bacterium]